MLVNNYMLWKKYGPLHPPPPPPPPKYQILPPLSNQAYVSNDVNFGSPFAQKSYSYLCVYRLCGMSVSLLL